MKRIIVLLAIIMSFSLVSCDTGNNGDDKDIIESPGQVDPSNPEKPTDEEVETDPRLTSFGSAGAWWLRKPIKEKTILYDITPGDPILEYCTEPGWSYLFYDDEAVIGYEPFPDRVDIMHSAVKLTVEAHNIENPNSKWGYINVMPLPPPPPVTVNDPVLGRWQFCLCIDDGTIVDGPYTAEYEWEWLGWKAGIARLTWESYNRDHDPDAHIVWGTD